MLDSLQCSAVQMLDSLQCRVVSDSLQPHGLQPTRLLCPWNFPGKNSGVGCHFLLQGIFPSRDGDQTHISCISCIGRWILSHRATCEAYNKIQQIELLFQCLVIFYQELLKVRERRETEFRDDSKVLGWYIRWGGLSLTKKGKRGGRINLRGGGEDLEISF